MSMDAARLLDKLPLAEATWLLWAKVLPDAQRGRCYEQEFTFAQISSISSTMPSFASQTAFYGKLRRMPIALI